MDFNLTHILTVGVIIPPMLVLEEVNFDDIDHSMLKYVAGKHRILTTMNISGSRVIHVGLYHVFPFHRSDIYR